MNAGCLIPFIILGCILQSCGAAMNGQLNKSFVNPWLASAVSFALITFFFLCAFLIMSYPDYPRYRFDALMGGDRWPCRRGAGLCRVAICNKVGAGPFVGFTVTAALIMSLLIDTFGWFRMDHHPLNIWRTLGGLLLIGGVTLIAKF